MNSKRLPWYVTIVSVVLLGGVLLAQRMRSGGGAEHPDPRPGITAAGVVPAAEFASSGPDVALAYAAAARYPEVMDGLYCHCRCRQTMDHRSLLTCFEGDHASGCDICQGEALMAAEMHQRGASLDAIRRAVDQKYGS